jgi:hypothetical protein
MSTFASKLAVVLAGFSAMVAASPTSLVADADLISHLGYTDLTEEHFASFTECVSSVKGSYRAYPEDGTLVVIPPTNRTADLESEDAAMWQCVIASSNKISIAFGSAANPDESLDGSKPVTNIQYSDAVGMGISGLTVVAHKPARRSPSESSFEMGRSLAKRDPGVYSMERDEGKTCEGDYDHHYVERCYNYNSAYESFQLTNRDCCQGIKLTIWPHHRCHNGNDKSYYCSASISLPCIKRRFYSFTAIPF